jgi:hypothetical protein
MRSLIALMLTLGLGTTPTLADADAVARFDAYARAVGPLCATAASTACFEVAFSRADRDGDGELQLDELVTMRQELELWLAAAGQVLAPEERTYTQLGLWVVDSVGLETLFRSYDRDGDGGLTRAEMTADIRLDERPLSAVVLDTTAVDWPAVRDRLGAFVAQALPLPYGTP